MTERDRNPGIGDDRSEDRSEVSGHDVVPAAGSEDMTPARVDHPTREELESGLKFAHLACESLRLEIVSCQANLYTLLEALIRRGVVSYQEMEQLRPQNLSQVAESMEGLPAIHLGPDIDKYDPSLPAEFDCASRVHLCGAPCCRIRFNLTFQDLEERIVHWDYFVPYQIAQKPDGTCIHLDGNRACSIFDHRPAICRTYDCRRDTRIWLDFDNKVINPELERLLREL